MTTAPVRLGIIGMVHGHLGFFMRQSPYAEIELVGIAEQDLAVVQRYTERYGLDAGLVYADAAAMLDAVKPEVVAAFGSIYDHLEVVRLCAPRGIHVMVEKPLAVSLDHAQQIAALARQYHIHVLTNYETSWYASNQAVYRVVHEDQALGRIRKVVVHDGHMGPKELGVGPEFLAWLTDPVLNGGGAVIDFGCYGPNLVTWLMQGQRPQTVTAILQQLKPDVYPQVDDEATIILTYAQGQAIIQGSWNWPYHRKDMDVYGELGSVHALDRVRVRYRIGTDDEVIETLESRPVPFDDPFRWLAAVVRGTVTLAEDDLAGLANNLLVMEILDAARESARTGCTVTLPPNS